MPRRDAGRGDGTDRASDPAEPLPASDPSAELFRLLADPTRRRILDVIAEHGEASVTAIAAEFPGLVASGISKHLMALRAAGLVTARNEGRSRLYSLDAATFTAALAPWLARYEPYFDAALGRLARLVESGIEPPA